MIINKVNNVGFNRDIKVNPEDVIDDTSNKSGKLFHYNGSIISL